MVGAAVRKPRVPNDKLHRVTGNRLDEADRKVLHAVCRVYMCVHVCVFFICVFFSQTKVKAQALKVSSRFTC